MSTTTDTRLLAVADALLTEPRTREAVQGAWDLVYEVVCVLDHDVMQPPPVNDDTRTARRFMEILAEAGHPVTLNATSALALALVQLRDGVATGEQRQMVRTALTVVRAATLAPA